MRIYPINIGAVECKSCRKNPEIFLAKVRERRKDWPAQTRCPNDAGPVKTVLRHRASPARLFLSPQTVMSEGAVCPQVGHVSAPFWAPTPGTPLAAKISRENFRIICSSGPVGVKRLVTQRVMSDPKRAKVFLDSTSSRPPSWARAAGTAGRRSLRAGLGPGDRASRQNGDGAPDITVALGGLVAGDQGLHVRRDAGTGIDIDAAA